MMQNMMKYSRELKYCPCYGQYIVGYFIIFLKIMHLHSVVNSGMFLVLQEVNKAIREEYLRRVFDSIQENDLLEELQPGIGLCMYPGSYLL